MHYLDWIKLDNALEIKSISQNLVNKNGIILLWEGSIEAFMII
jgi:hypothetical protein